MMKNLGSLLQRRCTSTLRALALLSRWCLSFRRLLVRLRRLLKTVLSWVSENEKWIIPIVCVLAEIVLTRVIGVAC